MKKKYVYFFIISYSKNIDWCYYIVSVIIDLVWVSDNINNFILINIVSDILC